MDAQRGEPVCARAVHRLAAPRGTRRHADLERAQPARTLVARGGGLQAVETPARPILVEREAVPAVSLLNRAPERGVGMAADYDGRGGFLDGLWMRLNAREGDEPPSMLGPSLGPDRADRGEIFVGDRAARPERNAQRAELRLEIAYPHAEYEPSAREHVEGGELLGQHQRIALRQDDDPGAEPDASGVGG